MDITIQEFIKFISVVLDIPIKSNINKDTPIIHLLHMVFRLYSEFKNSGHFKGREYANDTFALAAERSFLK